MTNFRLKIVVSISILLLVGGMLLALDRPVAKTKIGVILPLTGVAAKAGSDAKAAIEIAQSDFGREDLALIFEDDEFLPKNSVGAFTKLNTVDKVTAIIGPLNGSSIESVRKLAMDYKLPTMTPWGAGNSIGDYLYKNSVDAEDEAGAIASLAKDLGYLRPAIIYLQNDFGIKYHQAFTEAVKNNGGELVASEPVILSEKDFRTALTKIKAAELDALYIVHLSPGAGEIAKQARALGMNIQLFGQYGIESSELIDIGGSKVEGLIYTFTIDESALTKKQYDFIQKFTAKTGTKPQLAAFNAYDIYSLLVAATDKCGKDRICINNYLGEIREFQGVGGNFSIINGRIERTFYFKTIKNGEFVSFKK